jgi:plastocyanin
MPSRSRLRSASSRSALAAALGSLVCVLGLSGAASGCSRTTKHTVVMEAVSFQPTDLTVSAGDAVVWVNKDPFPHTATSSVFDSKTIAAGESWTYTAKTRGEFPYVCTLHPTMKGTLRVR